MASGDGGLSPSPTKHTELAQTATGCLPSSPRKGEGET